MTNLEEEVKYLYQSPNELGDLSSRLDINVKYGNFDFLGTMIRLLAIKDRDCILDVGCGTGKHLEEFRKRFDVKAFGIDPSITEERKEPISIQRYGAEEIPFENDFFDKLMCNYAMYYVADWQKALAGMMRVVKSGGKILISGPGIGNNENLYMLHKKAGYDISEIDVVGSEFMEEKLIPYLVKKGYTFSTMLHTNKVSYPKVDDFMDYYTSTSLFRMTSKEYDDSDIARNVRAAAEQVSAQGGYLFNNKMVRTVVIDVE